MEGMNVHKTLDIFHREVEGWESAGLNTWNDQKAAISLCCAHNLAQILKNTPSALAVPSHSYWHRSYQQGRGVT